VSLGERRSGLVKVGGEGVFESGIVGPSADVLLLLLSASCGASRCCRDRDRLCGVDDVSADDENAGRV
jgi:hypothetical protein